MIQSLSESGEAGSADVSSAEEAANLRINASLDFLKALNQVLGSVLIEEYYDSEGKIQWLDRGTMDLVRGLFNVLSSKSSLLDRIWQEVSLNRALASGFNSFEEIINTLLKSLIRINDLLTEHTDQEINVTAIMEELGFIPQKDSADAITGFQFDISQLLSLVSARYPGAPEDWPYRQGINRTNLHLNLYWILSKAVEEVSEGEED
jgi:hypothetical protein